MVLTFMKMFFILLLGLVGFTGMTLNFKDKDIEVKICDLEEEDLGEEDLEDLDASLGDLEDLEEDELEEYIGALDYVN